jgi:putative capsular polysaccharide synthesis protein
MLEVVKRPIYEWYTRRRGRNTIASLESHLRTHDPMLLVHQMGRAGSMTTVNSLRGAGITLPVYHTHWLHPRNVEKRLARFRDVAESGHPLNVRVGRRISDELQRVGPARRDWKLVTVFREPVARNISVFFLSIEVFVEDFARRHARGELDNAQLLSIFLREFPHDQPLVWFDMEMAEMFGVDVYRQPFPHEQGYQVLRNDRVDLLLIKVEALNACYRSAFAHFLGVNVPELAQTHVTEKDPSRPMYQDFIRDTVLPDEYLDRMYQSAFARHFYSDAELARFRRKWSTAGG